MICQYRLSLQSNALIPQSTAYRLYAWLLSQIPEKEADFIHEQDTHGISQYLDHGTWVVNLLNEPTIAAFDPILRSCPEIDLKEQKISAVSGPCAGPIDAPWFLQQKSTERRRELQFLSPTAFKQEGRYTIFPKEDLLIQSLVTRWNACFPGFLLEDEDLLDTLKQNIHVVDYQLRTCRYPLKNTRIPGFTGKIFLEAKLPVVLQELWNSLLLFSPYSGLGIKTTLGMGGIELPQKPQRY